MLFLGLFVILCGIDIEYINISSYAFDIDV